MSTGKARHAEDHPMAKNMVFLAINRIFPGAIVVLFAGVSSHLLKLTLLHRLQKAFASKRLMTCSAEHAWYQQPRDMRVYTDSTLCTLKS